MPFDRFLPGGYLLAVAAPLICSRSRHSSFPRRLPQLPTRVGLELGSFLSPSSHGVRNADAVWFSDNPRVKNISFGGVPISRR